MFNMDSIMISTENVKKVVKHGWKSRTIRFQFYLTSIFTAMMTAYTITPDSFRQLFDFVDETTWVKLTAIVAIISKGAFSALLRADTNRPLDKK